MSRGQGLKKPQESLDKYTSVVGMCFRAQNRTIFVVEQKGGKNE